MKVAAALGLAAFFAAGLVVGVRLLFVYARTRRAPELLAGVALLDLRRPPGFFALVLAFLPPDRYRRFVLARSGAPRDILRAGNAALRR